MRASSRKHPREAAFASVSSGKDYHLNMLVVFCSSDCYSANDVFGTVL